MPVRFVTPMNERMRLAFPRANLILMQGITRRELALQFVSVSDLKFVACLREED